jgi:hypothetical protein
VSVFDLLGDEREDDDEDIAPDGEDVASLMIVEEKERKRNSRIQYKSEKLKLELKMGFTTGCTSRNQHHFWLQLPISLYIPKGYLINNAIPCKLPYECNETEV